MKHSIKSRHRFFKEHVREYQESEINKNVKRVLEFDNPKDENILLTKRGKLCLSSDFLKNVAALNAAKTHGL